MLEGWLYSSKICVAKNTVIYLALFSPSWSRWIFHRDNLKWKDVVRSALKTGRLVNHFSKLQRIIPRLFNEVTMKKIRW